MKANTTKDDVTFELPAYIKHKHQVKLCNTVYDGIDTAKKHIQPTPNEHPDDFKIRVEKAVLDNYVERITTTMAGQIFRKPLSYEAVPQKVLESFDTISGQKSINQFGKQMVEYGILDGKAFVLVDMPEEGGDPYFAHVRREQLINWRKDDEGNYTMVVIRESYEEEVGQFAIEIKPQYRVIDSSGNVTLWRQSETAKEAWTTIEIQTDYDFCPFYELNISEVPPLYDIAKINVNYLNAFSKKDQYLDTAGSPIPFGKALGLNGDNQVLGGEDAESVDTPKIVLGVNSIVLADDPEADLKWVEMSGGSIDALQNDLDKKAKSMADRAIKLVEDSQQVKTATQTESENSESSSRLTDIADYTENTLNAVYNGFYRMKYSTEAVGSIIVNRDFNMNAMDSNLLTGLNTLEVSGNITKRMLLESLKKHEIVDIEDIDEVLDELERKGIDMQPFEDEDEAIE